MQMRKDECLETVKPTRERLKERDKHYCAENGPVPARVMKNNPRLQAADLCRAISVKEEAFMNCDALRTVRLEQVRTLERRAFCHCRRLEEIVFPQVLERLDLQTFADNIRLKRAVFRKESPLTVLGNEAFSGCAALQKLQLPSKLVKIGRLTFYKCVSLEEIEFPITLRELGPESFYQCGLRELELPEGLLVLGEGAFRKCRNLEYVYVPDTVRKIGKWVFHGCENLKVLEINHDPDEVGEWITNKLCTIRCPKGSRMEEYARNYGVKVEYL